mmetsp:Transcript_17758/g.36414  ORF Transcript_17758/g.36414 Transcript_17758/m.36414 type:complete len:347 (+) Transcript_17758:3524-4564(+)
MSYCKFEGHFCLRERLAVSIFFKKKIKIKSIRANSLHPGIKNFEIQLFSLIDKLIPGSFFYINENGTEMKFNPGNHLEEKIFHYTGKYRSLSYYLEFILYISNFRPKRLEVKLSGLRSSTLDVSLESILYVTIPLQRKWVNRDTRVKVFSTSFSSIRNTDLVLICSKASFKYTSKDVHPGLLKKLRLILSSSFSFEFPKQINERFLMKDFLAKEIDFSFFSFKIPNRRFNFVSLTLIGQTSNGCLFGNDFSTTKTNWGSLLSKKILKNIFYFFFEDLKTKGCVDKRNQVFLILNYLKKKKNTFSGIRIGKLTLFLILFFRDLKKLTGIVCKINPQIEKKSLVIEIS